MLTDEERKQVPKLKDLWLDIGAKDKAEVEEVVRIGDPITFQLGFQRMRNNQANSPAMDDKCGLWVVMEALRRASLKKLNCAAVRRFDRARRNRLARGDRPVAFGIDPHIGIAVDVTHATDCPTIDKKQEGDIALGKGPGDLSRAEHEPDGRRATDRNGQGGRSAAINWPPRAEPRRPTPTACK